MRTTPFLFFVASLVALAFGCGGDDDATGFDFVSADGYQGESSGPPDYGGADGGASMGDGGGGERSVEEGDIYRMLDAQTLLNLNSFRGLQVVDLADLTEPRIAGDLRVTGSPVEMYALGSRALVLLNSWRGYYGARDDVRVEGVEGGLVMLVDLSDRAHPRELDRAFVPGYIQTSRVAREGDRAALYVVASIYGEYEPAGGGAPTWEAHTIVKSFDVSTPDILERTELDLGGWVADIQATPDALLVARNDWARGMGSRVSIVDISDVDGTMIEGAEVEVAGTVATQFNMDLRGGILRVASGATWSGTRENHLETFDATDIATLTPIDHCTYGEGEDLYATIFLEDRAFFVTYLRVDPFHAFALDAAGHCEERAEFVVSGWNDFFRPVLSDTRLVGIGVNDETSRTMAVSLYDITDLDNPTPLIARAEVEAESSWSEASFDHRAFSVLEGAVSATAMDGTAETGLVLLPFMGWDTRGESYRAAVQLYTFSDHTLTRRGVMDHGTPVRRSFVPTDDVAANLSEAELSLHDTTDVDAPAELSRLELAPSYTRVLRFGDHRVRLHDTQSYWSWWGPLAERPTAFAEIVRASDDPDRAAPIATIEVPANASLYAVGSLLVAVDAVPRDTSTWPYVWDTTIVAHDLSNPAAPREAGRLVTDRIRPDGYGYGYDCFDCGYYRGYGYGLSARVVGDALVFPRLEEQRRLLGTEHVCHTWPTEARPCIEGDDCTYWSGGITCRTLDDGPEICEGAIASCTWDVDAGVTECTELDPSTVATDTSCYDHERYRYWQSMTLDVVDLETPATPILVDAIVFPTTDESVGLVTDGATVHYAYKRPVSLDDDPRPHAAHFFRPIELATPARPVLGPEINVPGQLVSARGAALLTRDLRWGEHIAETVLHRLERTGDRATLVASHPYTDRLVETVLLDGAGHVLVTHRAPWYYGGGAGGGGVVVSPGGDRGGAAYEPELVHLSILDGTSLTELGAAEVDSWATLSGAVGARALFQVPGGLLLMSLADPTTPRSQAYFPVLGWGADIALEGDDIVFAAGPYGIYRFDADTENLLSR